LHHVGFFYIYAFQKLTAGLISAKARCEAMNVWSVWLLSGSVKIEIHKSVNLSGVLYAY
jgi:hypothetical protein